MDPANLQPAEPGLPQPASRLAPPNLVHLSIGLFVIRDCFDIAGGGGFPEKRLFRFLALPVTPQPAFTNVGWYNLLAPACLISFLPPCRGLRGDASWRCRCGRRSAATAWAATPHALAWSRRAWPLAVSRCGDDALARFSALSTGAAKMGRQGAVGSYLLTACCCCGRHGWHGSPRSPSWLLSSGACDGNQLRRPVPISTEAPAVTSTPSRPTCSPYAGLVLLDRAAGLAASDGPAVLRLAAGAGPQPPHPWGWRCSASRQPLPLRLGRGGVGDGWVMLFNRRRMVRPISERRADRGQHPSSDESGR